MRNKKLTRAELIHDLRALAEYFNEECGAAPLAIIQAAEMLEEEEKEEAERK